MAYLRGVRAIVSPWMNICPTQNALSAPSVHTALPSRSVLSAPLLFWMEARQAESSHTQRGAAPVSSSSPRGTAEAHQSRRSAGPSGQFNFLKLQCLFFFSSSFKGGEGETTSKDSTLYFFKVKAPQHCSWKVFLFSFLLNVKSHVSRSPITFRLSAYVQNRHHSVITSFFKRNKYHICVHIFTNWKDSWWW